MIVLFLIIAFLVAVFISQLLDGNNDTKGQGYWVPLVIFTGVLFYIIWKAFLDVT